MNIKQERQFIQELLESGKLDSLSVQVIALNMFANSIGYTPVDGDVRKGFVGYDHETWNTTHNISLEDMQYKYNHYPNPKAGEWFMKVAERQKKTENRIVDRISLQHNKRTTKKLTTQLYWLKFVKEV